LHNEKFLHQPRFNSDFLEASVNTNSSRKPEKVGFGNTSPESKEGKVR
jgi:hypothetical protein